MGLYRARAKFSQKYFQMYIKEIGTDGFVSKPHLWTIFQDEIMKQRKNILDLPPLPLAKYFRLLIVGQ